MNVTLFNRDKTSRCRMRRCDVSSDKEKKQMIPLPENLKIRVF